MDLIKVKRKHWNHYRKSKLLYHLDKYKELRSRIKYQIRIEYANFIKDSENSIKQDPKNFWNMINTKKNTSNIPGVITSNDKILTSPQEIVEAFAHQFASVFNYSNDHFCDNACDIYLGSCKFCDKVCCPSVISDKSVIILMIKAVLFLIFYQHFVYMIVIY